MGVHGVHRAGRYGGTEAVRTLLCSCPGSSAGPNVCRSRRTRDLDLAPPASGPVGPLQYDGPPSVNELADRLEVAPTTVSLMVSELARPVFWATTDAADRRRRIIAVARPYAEPIRAWLSGSATAWEHVMSDLSPAERATVVTAPALQRRWITERERGADRRSEIDPSGRGLSGGAGAGPPPERSDPAQRRRRERPGRGARPLARVGVVPRDLVIICWL